MLAPGAAGRNTPTSRSKSFGQTQKIEPKPRARADRAKPLPRSNGLNFCEIFLVGAKGFEPPTSCSQSRRSTRLSYAPIQAACIAPTSKRCKPYRQPEQTFSPQAQIWATPRAFGRRGAVVAPRPSRSATRCASCWDYLEPGQKCSLALVENAATIGGQIAIALFLAIGRLRRPNWESRACKTTIF